MDRKTHYHHTSDGKLYLKTFLIALLVSALIFLPFILIDRGLFLFYGDYNVQQIPFYQLAHRAIKAGRIGFDFYTDLGANFIGSYSFYLLGSPFFWLTIPFPTSFLPYLMAPLFCLKFAVAATTSCAFIRRFVHNKNYALLGGLLYAFSGFGIYNIFFNHFHEVIAFFPLLLLSLEKFITEKCRGFFAVSVFICATCNYFFFFGEVVFVIIYFFVRLFSSSDWKITFKSFMALFFEAVIGLALSMFLMLPALIAILGNPRINTILDGWYFLTYSNVQRYFAIIECLFFPPDIPARPNFLPDGNAKWASLGAWLPLFSMCGVITFMQTHKKHFIRRLLAISAVMALIPGLNSIYFALNDAYYARWFFMPILIMSLATVIALENCRTKELNTGIRWTLIITAAFTVIGVMPEKTDDGINFGLTPYPERFWTYTAIALFSILLVAIFINVLKRKKNFLKWSVCFVCIITLIYSYAFIGFGKTHSYDENFIIDNAIYGSEKISFEEDGKEFFRIDVYDDMDNLPMFWQYPSIQAFHSIVPESVMSFYDSIGVQRDVASRPESEYYALRTLTGCKYLFVKDDRSDVDLVYGFEQFDHQNGFNIYKNEYYVPMGWTYDYYCTEEDYENTTLAYRDRLLIKAICLSDDQIKKYGGNLSRVASDEMLYEYTLKEDTDILRGQCASSFMTTRKGFKSSITLDKANLVFFSVPYDSGFSATVNGKSVEVERVNKGFVAVYAEAGENEIEFTYTTPGLYYGLLISGAALILFLIYMTVVFFQKKAEKKTQAIRNQNIDEFVTLISDDKSDEPSFNVHSADIGDKFRLPREQDDEEKNDGGEKDE